MHVSDHYRLGLRQPQLDFVDVAIETDTPLFVDPRALLLVRTEWGEECVAHLDEVPAGGAVSVLAGTRTVSASTGGYYAQINFNTTGSIYANFIRLSNATGTQTAITTSANSNLDTYTADRWVNVRFAATGTSPTALSLKLWYDGSPEPSGWTFTATDSNADQQQAGSLAMGASTAAGVSNLNVTAQFDYLSASDGSDTAKCYRWTESSTSGAGS